MNIERGDARFRLFRPASGPCLENELRIVLTNLSGESSGCSSTRRCAPPHVRLRIVVCLLLLLIWQSSEIKIKSQRREEINNHTEFDNGRYHIV
jgi:hypothetical protein